MARPSYMPLRVNGRPGSRGVDVPHLVKWRGPVAQLCFGSLYICSRVRWGCVAWARVQSLTVVEYMGCLLHRFCHYIPHQLTGFCPHITLFLQACDSSKAVNDLLEAMLLLEALSHPPIRFMIAAVLRLSTLSVATGARSASYKSEMV